MYCMQRDVECGEEDKDGAREGVGKERDGEMKRKESLGFPHTFPALCQQWEIAENIGLC